MNEYEQRAKNKKSQLEKNSLKHRAKDGLNLSLIEKIAVKRKKLDMPITFDDLKFGTKNLIGDNLTHVSEKMQDIKE
jgi:hypothetical protein